MDFISQFGKMDEYKDIIGIIKETPPVRPPDHFSERVMGLLPDDKPGMGRRLKTILWQPRYTPMVSRFTEAKSWAECSLCFLMAGFFYLIMGVVLILGFKKFGNQMPVAKWIMIQPHIALVTAFGFMVLGISLLKKSTVAVKLVHLGTSLYIAFAMINGIAVQMAIENPAMLGSILPFMTGGVLMGAFLAIIVQKYRRRIVSEQG